MILDLQKFLKTKKDKEFEKKTSELPSDVDSEGTVESRAKAINASVKTSDSIYSKLMKMRASKQVRDASNPRPKTRAVSARGPSSAEAADVKMGLGTKGRSGSF